MAATALISRQTLHKKHPLYRSPLSRAIVEDVIDENFALFIPACWLREQRVAH